MYKIPCQNCKGHGKIDHFKHVENGICFTCSGSGYLNVNEDEYNEYQKELERKKQGKYILFNNGSIEYYKTTKEITSKYGTFYTGNYGDYSVHEAYKHKNIVFTEYTKNYQEFINVCNEEYNKFINKKIKQCKEWLTDEDNTPEEIEHLTNKLKSFEKQLIK